MKKSPLSMLGLSDSDFIRHKFVVQPVAKRGQINAYSAWRSKRPAACSNPSGCAHEFAPAQPHECSNQYSPAGRLF